MDKIIVGRNVRTIRESRNVSQKELGELIGKSASTVGDYEAGNIDIPCTAILSIAEALKCGPEEFFGVKSDQFNPIAELRIYTQEDRKIVAGILIMNGYTVRQMKIPKEKGKSNYYCLQAKLEETSLESQ